jgi:DNA-binding response OmpR family regulator
MPKLVIGLIHGELARGLESHFKQVGWRVCSADTSEELRAKAHGNRAAAVVLPVSAADAESGFLTCAKLVQALPNARLVLVGPASKKNERLARFAGAAGYVAETATAAELIAAVAGKPTKVS